jgi:hypothetical protein
MRLDRLCTMDLKYGGAFTSPAPTETSQASAGGSARGRRAASA